MLNNAVMPQSLITLIVLVNDVSDQHFEYNLLCGITALFAGQDLHRGPEVLGGPIVGKEIWKTYFIKLEGTPNTD